MASLETKPNTWNQLGGSVPQINIYLQARSASLEASPPLGSNNSLEYFTYLTNPLPPPKMRNQLGGSLHQTQNGQLGGQTLGASLEALYLKLTSIILFQKGQLGGRSSSKKIKNQLGGSIHQAWLFQKGQLGGSSSSMGGGRHYFYVDLQCYIIKILIQNLITIILIFTYPLRMLQICPLSHRRE